MILCQINFQTNNDNFTSAIVRFNVELSQLWPRLFNTRKHFSRSSSFSWAPISFLPLNRLKHDISYSIWEPNSVTCFIEVKTVDNTEIKSYSIILLDIWAINGILLPVRLARLFGSTSMSEILLLSWFLFILVVPASSSMLY